jgi:glyoxylase I family protein
MPIKLMGVHHIMVTVGDIKIAKQFYESVLGLEETDCPVKDGKRVWYKLGTQELHVNFHKNNRAGISHFAISIEPGKYHDYYQQVKKSGYEKVTESHLFKEDGLHRFFVDDPFGNTIEITDGQIKT